ncbi:MAG: GerMN domain-containing protein [Lachnospiraceae bacterium]|nr:GerMN domain-containing protein [Lachnospiraceae bacterium]
MRQKIRWESFLILLLIAAFLLCGCGGKEAKNQEDNKDDKINLYYLNGKGDSFHKKEYRLRETHNPENACYEVLARLGDAENLNSDEYRSPNKNNVNVKEASYDSGNRNVNLDFGAGYRKMSSTDEVLMRTAVVRSVLQIPGISSVSFSVEGVPLSGANHIQIGNMTSGDYITNIKKRVYSYSKRVTLFYLDKEGKRLVPVKRTIKMDNNVPVETQILRELKKVPKNSDYHSALPKNLKINETQVIDNVCYVDLGAEMLESEDKYPEKLVVYSMVNSLTELPHVAQVQFTINDEKVSTINDFSSFHKLLSHEYSLYDEKE